MRKADEPIRGKTPLLSFKLNDVYVDTTYTKFKLKRAVVEIYIIEEDSILLANYPRPIIINYTIDKKSNTIMCCNKAVSFKKYRLEEDSLAIESLKHLDLSFDCNLADNTKLKFDAKALDLLNLLEKFILYFGKNEYILFESIMSAYTISLDNDSDVDDCDFKFYYKISKPNGQEVYHSTF